MRLIALALLLLTGCTAQETAILWQGEAGYRARADHAQVEAEAIERNTDRACVAARKLGYGCDWVFIAYTQAGWSGATAIGVPSIGMPRACEGLIGYSPRCSALLAHELAHAWGIRSEIDADYVGGYGRPGDTFTRGGSRVH
jgi:hypothetical protein